jgi:hypothetical protein
VRPLTFTLPLRAIGVFSPPLHRLLFATAVKEALILLAYQVLLGILRDLCTALAWALIAALAGIHICIFGLGQFLQPFWCVCGLLIYLHYLFQCLTLAAYVLLICHFIWTNLA